jgi:basic amino acid/polyamine antiporter, APA family
MAATDTSEAGLVRAIGARQLTASIINVTIGAGIFVLPAAAASGLGPAAKQQTINAINTAQTT